MLDVERRCKTNPPRCVVLRHVAWRCARLRGSKRAERTHRGCSMRTPNIQHRTSDIEVKRMRNEPTEQVVSCPLSANAEQECAERTHRHPCESPPLPGGVFDCAKRTRG